ncbi:FAD:protein FMN transferase [Colwellia psychrerythraea]|uniref:FAD:protein FMN transferase n=1 Tax=Colwellia psychrerythraea (strain 34H / ATCC BAA-681) TaxID=167879 RepID=Q487D5_COLP3|nr:FAD:protein FMN transferase [Colwellia psychrerythraea]AAZ25001.1 thiamine biosynthesis lipoprotein ApbE [Colwellia psychrerythraea 34H]
MNTLKLLLLTTLVLTLSACFPSNPSKNTEILLQGHTMGTTYNIKVVATKEQLIELKLQQQIDAALEQVNQEMSTYIPDSELSKFNQSTSTAAIEVSPGFARVLKESIRLGQLSEGKLDVTVGPLVNLWGFGPEQRPETVPSDEILAATKKRIGLQNITLEGNLLSKKIPDLYIDLSTIAKGYGVDVVAELIESNGFTHYLVEIGGEMRLRGFKHTGELWAIAIERPILDQSGEERAVHQVVIPKDNAVATSGDYRNYFEADGRRFSHIIDPETGKPIDHNLVSVTVIHPSSMTADGLSTTLMVMGMEKGMAFASENNLAALFISKTENGFDERFTVKFKQYLK